MIATPLRLGINDWSDMMLSPDETIVGGRVIEGRKRVIEEARKKQSTERKKR